MEAEETVAAEEARQWHEFYCPKCHHEEAFFGGPPDEYEFRCECPEPEAGS